MRRVNKNVNITATMHELVRHINDVLLELQWMTFRMSFRKSFLNSLLAQVDF